MTGRCGRQPARRKAGSNAKTIPGGSRVNDESRLRSDARGRQPDLPLSRVDCGGGSAGAAGPHRGEDRRAALNSRLHHWVSDLDGAIEQARDRLDRAVDALAAHGVDAVGSVGDSDPLVAIDDALRSFAAHEIIIATHPPGQSNWLERNLVERVRERHGLPVTHLTSSYDLQPA
jgi:hypothetical protein